jgi:hypothetical protein
MVSATVACLPAAVSLLLVEALFMQISELSLALTWPCRFCLLRFLLCASLCYKLSPFQALGKVTLHPCSQACMFIYSSCVRWVFLPLLCGSPPTSAFTSFPAPAYWAIPHFFNPFISHEASGCFKSIVIVNSAAINMGVHMDLSYPGVNFFNVCLVVTSLDHVVVLFLVF